MKKLGMGALIALSVAGLSLAALNGCEKKPADNKKPADTNKPAEGGTGGEHKPADGGH